MNIPKTLKGILNALRDTYVVEMKTITLSVSGSSYASGNIDATKAGYVPIGVVGMRASSSGNSYISFYIFSANSSSNTVSVGIRNHSSTARDMTVEVDILYLKLGGGTE